MPLLFAGFQLKYMTGAKLIINESGNWEVQSVLCEDSPQHALPHLWTDKPGIHSVPKEFAETVLPEAKKLAHTIGYESDWCKGYRDEALLGLRQGESRAEGTASGLLRNRQGQPRPA